MNFKSFDEILRTYLIRKEKEERPEHDNDYWYGSELGLCQRKHFFRRLGIKASNEKAFRIRFLAEDGKALHKWREKAAQEMGVVLESEGDLKDEDLRYKGKFDLIIKIEEKPVLIDIKSQRPEAFFRRERLPAGQKIKEFQKIQLASYVWFAKVKYPNLEEARLYYVDRGGGLREEYIFHFKEEMFKKVLEILQNLNICWKLRRFPEIQKTNWECKWCPYKSICQKVVRDKLTVNQILELYGQEKKGIGN